MREIGLSWLSISIPRGSLTSLRMSDNLNEGYAMLMRWYHTCGYSLQVETKDYGQQHHFTKFYDGHEGASQQRLRNCPACQMPLALSNLKTHPIHHEQDVNKIA